MLDQACRGEAREGGGVRMGLNKVAADPTGAPVAPSVAAINRHDPSVCCGNM